MQIVKGQTKTVSFSFKKQGVTAVFTNPPVWSLTSESGKRLLSGTASLNSSSKWEASITIPVNYTMFNTPVEQLVFESSGFDNKKQSYIIEKEISLIEENDDFTPTGVVYNMLSSNKMLVDSIVLSYSEVAKITATVKTPFDEVIISSDFLNPVFSTLTSSGYKFTLPFGSVDIPYIFNDPLLIVLEVYKSLTDIPYIEVHPLYVLNSRTAVLSSSLEQYLNKARLDEIDPSLQFSTADYLHYISEGIKIINAKDTASWWTVVDIPLSLQQYLFAAAAWTALNARYLAEGQTQFEFSGLNANLNFNRNEVFSTKMQEMQSYLDNGLPPAKKSAIVQFGRGTIPPGSTGQQRNLRNASMLKISGSSLTGYRNYRNINRRII